MAKGVKRIKWTGEGQVIKNLSTPNKKVVITGDQEVYFTVDLWYEGTTEADKKKDVTWMLQDRKRNTIIVQKIHSANTPQRISIPNPLCGPFEYYVEASLSGQRDLTNKTGLLVSGHCPSKIISSKWCKTNDGKDVGKDYQFKYGQTIYLNLMTEGLNGSLNLSVDIFRKLDDSKTSFYRYTSVDVIDGEINLAIKNTYSWLSKHKDLKETEDFYVKVFDPSNNLYIPNDKKETKHACYLKINKKIASKEIKTPTNLSPLKTGEPGKDKERHELCRFETINITESKKKPVRIFDNGEKLKAVSNPKMSHSKTIIFDFDKYDITGESKTTLNNILQYLLGYQHSYIKIDGQACVIGKEQYNQKLSQQRSDAVKKIFTDGGLDGSRIVSIGHGEVNPTDDKKGRDNIKYKDEKEYKENRRVEITFDSYGHDAQTIVYETIAKSQNQNYTIDITEYQNKACLKEVKHKKNIKINSPEYSKAIDQVTAKLDFPVKSNLSQFNLFPLKYIWPKVFANQYDIHVHSCRYFSLDSNPTVRVMAYPDIKWDFHFFLNLSNNLSVKWQKLPPSKHKEMQSKAGKIGAEKRWKQTEIDFGVVLEANWDKIDAEKYDKHFDATLKYEEKIKQFYSVFASLKEFSKGVTDTTKGKIRSNKFTDDLPLKIEVNPPNFCLGATWQLERAKKNELKLQIIGTSLELYFEAKPIIGIELTIDLLDMAIQAGVGVVSGGTANLAAKKILNNIRQWLEEDGNPVTLKMYIDLKLNGTISGESQLKFNTESDTGEANGKLSTTIGLELNAGIEIKAKFAVIIAEAFVEGKLKASGKASGTFGHKLTYEQKSSTEKTLYYVPELKFNGLKVTIIVKATVGLSIKKGILKGDHTTELVDFEDEYIIIPEFDVIENLEKYAGVIAKIPLL